MKSSFSLRFSVFLLVILTSCEKVIDLNIRESETKLVIEGNITDQAGPYSVRVSQSAYFNAAGQGKTIENATVTISDDTGFSETLIYKGNGNYQTRQLKGTAGRTYSLKVAVGAETYTATSIMPPSVKLENLTYESAGPGKTAFVYFTDPSEIVNYYRFVMYINDRKQDDIYVSEDRFYNGIKTRTPLFTGGGGTPSANELKTNDRLQVELYCIDAKVYDYFYSLSDLLSGNSASPANPNSNISGGALGYFSAHSVSDNKLLIK